MKKIVFTRPDGGLSVMIPVEGARLAFAITLSDGTVIGKATPVPVEQLKGRWPIPGAIAQFAETEDEFVNRIRIGDVPANAINVQIVDSSLIPTDRTNRDAWEWQP